MLNVKVLNISIGKDLAKINNGDGKEDDDVANNLFVGK
jgi:hypothetical protein